MNKQRIEELLEIELQSNKKTSLTNLVKILVDKSIKQNKIPKGEAMAASFDLLVGLFYYEKINTKGWIHCSHDKSTYFFPYVNVCPRCVLNNNFIYHKAGKGQSANIGAATINALIFFIQEWFNQTNPDILVIKGEEPVDLIVFDKLNDLFFLAEVKSAPLLTLPLVIDPELALGQEPEFHKEIDLSSLKNLKLGLMLPFYENSKWTSKTFYFKNRYDESADYFLEEITSLVKDNEINFLDNYFKTWNKSINAYSKKDKGNNVFWLTGGCGRPNSTVWPHSSSISDGKTSVGMDRTDDIKKAVYQLLKLRMTDIAKNNVKVKVGILSNIHAARHYKEYIKPIENIKWTINNSEVEKYNSSDLFIEQPNYSLYDGIITFTKIYTNDLWLMKTFNFN